MPVSVSLKEIADTLQATSQTHKNYLDLETGETVLVTDEDSMALEESDFNDLPDWQREHLKDVQSVLNAERVLQLPDSFDIHEWSIMERYCYSIPDPTICEELLDAIHGSGAFRLFHRTVERFNLTQQWYSYRDQAFEQIARDWLEENEIPYHE